MTDLLGFCTYSWFCRNVAHGIYIGNCLDRFFDGTCCKFLEARGFEGNKSIDITNNEKIQTRNETTKNFCKVGSSRENITAKIRQIQEREKISISVKSDEDLYLTEQESYNKNVSSNNSQSHHNETVTFTTNNLVISSSSSSSSTPSSPLNRKTVLQDNITTSNSCDRTNFLNYEDSLRKVEISDFFAFNTKTSLSDTSDDYSSFANVPQSSSSTSVSSEEHLFAQKLNYAEQVLVDHRNYINFSDAYDLNPLPENEVIIQWTEHNDTTSFVLKEPNEDLSLTERESPKENLSSNNLQVQHNQDVTATTNNLVISSSSSSLNRKRILQDIITKTNSSDRSDFLNYKDSFSELEISDFFTLHTETPFSDTNDDYNSFANVPHSSSSTSGSSEYLTTEKLNYVEVLVDRRYYTDFSEAYVLNPLPENEVLNQWTKSNETNDSTVFFALKVPNKDLYLKGLYLPEQESYKENLPSNNSHIHRKETVTATTNKLVIISSPFHNRETILQDNITTTNSFDCTDFLIYKDAFSEVEISDFFASHNFSATSDDYSSFESVPQSTSSISVSSEKHLTSQKLNCREEELIDRKKYTNFSNGYVLNVSSENVAKNQWTEPNETNDSTISFVQKHPNKDLHVTESYKENLSNDTTASFTYSFLNNGNENIINNINNPSTNIELNSRTFTSSNSFFNPSHLILSLFRRQNSSNLKLYSIVNESRLTDYATAIGAITEEITFGNSTIVNAVNKDDFPHINNSVSIYKVNEKITHSNLDARIVRAKTVDSTIDYFTIAYTLPQINNIVSIKEVNVNITKLTEPQYQWPSPTSITKKSATIAYLLHCETVTSHDLSKIDCGRSRSNLMARITRGQRSQHLKWPWMLFLHRLNGAEYKHKCGVTLLNQKWAIKVAHCLDGQKTSDCVVRLGEFSFWRIDEFHRHVELHLIYIHPDFHIVSYESGLAFLHFYETVRLQINVIPICLRKANEEVKKTGVVAGWNKLSNGELPELLNEVRMPINSNKECDKRHLNVRSTEVIGDGFLCAGVKNGGLDACEGTSGGPLVLKDNISFNNHFIRNELF